ncbi:glycosyltransferase family 2 protein [Actinophytocola glycyrrhizae]|uniref:Glycosyltransferase family 2 protein n=1 Tax=Actinophytocola glycyrrhizae TaxID=2044873 RepID=A0ABV9S5D7_9PSEU
MSTVDIMMPFYGDVAMMQASVRSVLAQDDPRWRLTVVDDGDDPAVPGWFAGIGDERVRYLRNPENLGLTGNFNRCVELVEHELAVLIGCDDLMLPNYVGVVRGVHADHPDAGIIQPGVRVIDSAGDETRTLVDEAKRILYKPRFDRRLELAGEALAVSLLRGDWLYFPAICWRSAALKELRFRPDLRVIQDLALLMELVRRGERLVADRTVCFSYRRHDASESSSTAFDGSRFTEAGEFFADIAEQMAAHGWPRAARVARLHLSSRLFALTNLPGALRAGGGVRPLVRHAFGPGRVSPRARRP